MNLSNKEFKDSKVYISTSIFTLAIMLISYSLLTKFLSPDIYGNFIFLQGISMICASILNLGCTVGFKRNFFDHYKSEENLNSFIFTSQVVIFIIFSIFFLFNFLFTNEIFSFLNKLDNQNNFWHLILLSSLIDLFCKYYFIFLINKKKSKIYSRLIISKYLIYLVLLIFFFQFNKNIFSLVNSLLISNTIILFIIFYLQRDLKLKYFNWKYFKELLKISLPLTPRVLFGTINSKIDKICITLLTNVSNTGIYAIGQSIAYSVFQLMSSLDKVFITKLNYSLFSNKVNNIGKQLMPYLIFCFLFTYFLILFLNEFLYIFIDKNFYSSKFIIIVFSIYHLSLFFGKISSTQLIFKKKVWVNSGVFVLNMILNSILNIPLILYFGVFGAVLATVVSGVGCQLISIYYANRYNKKIKYNNFQIFKIFISLIILLFSNYFLFNNIENISLNNLIIKILLILMPFVLFREIITMKNLKKMIDV